MPLEPAGGLRLLLAVRFEQICRQDRGQRKGDQGRCQEGKDNRPHDPLEHELDDPAGEGQRHQGHAEHEGDGQDGQPHLADAVDRGLLGRLAHAQVPLDGVDVDDGVVNEPSDGEQETDQGGAVEGHPERHHDQERHADGDRDGDHRDEGPADIPEKEKDHQSGEEHGDDELLNHVIHQETDKRGVVVGHIELQAGEVLLDLLELGLHPFDHRHRAGVGLLDDRDLDRLFAV